MENSEKTSEKEKELAEFAYELADKPDIVAAVKEAKGDKWKVIRNIREIVENNPDYRKNVLSPAGSELKTSTPKVMILAEYILKLLDPEFKGAEQLELEKIALELAEESEIMEIVKSAKTSYEAELNINNLLYTVPKYKNKISQLEYPGLSGAWGLKAEMVSKSILKLLNEELAK